MAELGINPLGSPFLLLSSLLPVPAMLNPTVTQLTEEAGKEAYGVSPAVTEQCREKTRKGSESRKTLYSTCFVISVTFVRV